MTDIHRSQSGNVEWAATPDALGLPRDLEGLFLGNLEVQGTITVEDITSTTDLTIDPTGDLILKGGVTFPPTAGASGEVLTLVDNMGTTAWQPGGGGGSTNFIGLTDTPGTYAGQSGFAVVVNGAEDGLEFVSLAGGTTDFTGLTDTPANYTGAALTLVRVNAGQTALEFGADLSNLDDVSASVPNDGDVLTWNNTGSTWEPSAPTGGASDFVSLTDTPANYSGASGLFVRVNVGETGLEFVAGSGSGLNDVVDDLTPQLGGDLDVNGFDIISVSGNDINLLPDSGIVNLGTAGDATISSDPGSELILESGTGTVTIGSSGTAIITSDPAEDLELTPGATLVLDGLNWPTADGTNGQVLTTDGAGTLSFTTVAGGSGLNDVVDDLTPQLGGNLDVNGQSIVSVSNGNIDITPDGSGQITFGGNPVLITTGAMQLESGTDFDVVAGAGDLSLSSGGGAGQDINLFAGALGNMNFDNGSGVTPFVIVPTASGANALQLAAGTTGNGPTLSATGETNSDIVILPAGTGVISVAGTTDYENNVTDDDDIPNKKYVDDEIAAISAGNQISQLDSSVTVTDTGSDGTITTVADSTTMMTTTSTGTTFNTGTVSVTALDGVTGEAGNALNGADDGTLTYVDGSGTLTLMSGVWYGDSGKGGPVVGFDGGEIHFAAATNDGLTINNTGIQGSSQQNLILEANSTFDLFIQSNTGDIIQRVNGDVVLRLSNPSNETVNGLQIDGAITGNNPTISIENTLNTPDTNVDIVIVPNGTGVISVAGTTNYEDNVTDDDDIPNKAYVDPTVQAGGTVTANTDFDPDSGTEIHWTFGAAATAEVGFAASSIPSTEVTMEVTNGGQGTLTWGSEIQWAGGTAPTLTAAGTDLLKFWTRDSGTTWIGWTVALNVS
jgi:hypothetical protein